MHFITQYAILALATTTVIAAPVRAPAELEGGTFKTDASTVTEIPDPVTALVAKRAGAGALEDGIKAVEKTPSFLGKVWNGIKNNKFNIGLTGVSLLSSGSGGESETTSNPAPVG